MSACRYTWPWAHIQKLQGIVFLYYSLLSCFVTGSLTRIQLGWLAIGCSEPASLTKHQQPCLAFHMVAEDSNPGPHAAISQPYILNTLVNAKSSQAIQGAKAKGPLLALYS